MITSFHHQDLSCVVEIMALQKRLLTGNQALVDFYITGYHSNSTTC